MTDLSIDQRVRKAASDRPHHLALADAPNRNSFFAGGPQRLSWAEVDNAVEHLAASLRSIGAGPGVPVAIQLPNVVELVLTILACGRVGAVSVPFPVQHRAHELRYGLGVSRAQVMVTDTWPGREDQLEVVGSVIKALDGDVSLACFGASAAAHQLAINTEAPDTVGAPLVSDLEAPLTVCWTSGTTGTPKGVPRSTSRWLASGNFQVDELSMSADERILCPFPVVNMAGIGGMVVPWAIVGATLHLHQPLDLPVYLQQLEAEKITYTVAPPPLLNMLLANEAMLNGVDLSALRMISSGSAPLDPWMVEGWDKRGIEIVNVFGSNEGAALLSTRSAVPDPTERARYFPEPEREGVRIRLVDLESGEDVADAGVIGELRFAGSTVFTGYLESDGAEFDEKGYYRTGDLFEWVDGATAPRLLRFVDRAKDIIIRGGMNISAAEIEGLISSHSGVSECAVVAFPDATLGEKVGVFVVAAGADDAPTLGEVVAYLRDAGIASYKLPERLELIATLPRNPVGKVTKSELRERWASSS